MSHSLWFILIWRDPSLGGAAWPLQRGYLHLNAAQGKKEAPSLRPGSNRRRAGQGRSLDSVNKTGYAKEGATRHFSSPLGRTRHLRLLLCPAALLRGQRQKEGQTANAATVPDYQRREDVVEDSNKTNGACSNATTRLSLTSIQVLRLPGRSGGKTTRGWRAALFVHAAPLAEGRPSPRSPL